MPVLVAAAASLVVGVPLFTLLSRVGVGRGPVWVPVVGLVLTVALAQEGPQRRIGSGSLSSRPVLRVVVGLSCFALLLGGSGMTYLFPPAGVLVGAVHIDRSGPAVSRAAAALTAGFTVLLQVLVAAGVLPCALPGATAHVSALMSLLMALVAIVSFGQNARARQDAAQHAVWADRRLRALVDNSYDLTVITDAEAVALAVYGAAQALVGRSAESLLGTRYTDLVHSDDLPLVAGLGLRLRALSGQVHRAEVRVRQGDGSYRWHEVTGQDLRGDPAVGGIVLHQRDVQERRVWQDGLARAADRDPLTGLLNRAALERRLHDRLGAAGDGGPVAVLFCDLDRFKEVNDTHGHGVGDLVLVGVARRLAEVLGPQAQLARVGGDEFVALLPSSAPQTETAAEAMAQAAASRLRVVLVQPLLVGELTVCTGVSVGIAVACPDGPGSTQAPSVALTRLLEQADRRMYQDKRRQTADGPAVNGSSLVSDRGDDENRVGPRGEGADLRGDGRLSGATRLRSP